MSTDASQVPSSVASDQIAAPSAPPAFQEQCMQMWEQAKAFGQDVLFGPHFDVDQGSVTICRTKVSPADDEWKTLGEAYGIRVQLETSKWTMTQCDERIQELWRQAAQAPEFDVSSMSFSPNGIEVLVRAGLEEARTYFATIDDVSRVQFGDAQPA